MKKFLFSNSHKNHYTDTVVRMGKNNLGFSLVELIIVIAIMAVLVAIAIPVLGVFIEKAEKNNDKQVVSDILYAIDLANEEGAFMEYQNVVLGDIEYPVAFIVLRKDGTSVVTTTTSIQPVAEQCVFEELTLVSLTEHTQYVTCSKCSSGEIQAYYDAETVTVRYCTKHSTPDKNTANNTKKEAISPGIKNCMKVGPLVYHSYNEAQVVSRGGVFTNNIGTFLQEVGNSGKCAKAQQGVLSVGSINPDTQSGPVHQALVNAFGADYRTELKLSHEEWMENENFNYTTLYNSAETLFADVKELGSLLAIASGAAKGTAASMGIYIAGEYDDAGDVMISIADKFATVHQTYSSFEQAWLDAPTQETHYTFGMGGVQDGMEYYAACRKGYNAAFASYLDACGCSYADIVRNYYSQKRSLASIELAMPAVVTHKSFVLDENAPDENLLYVNLKEELGLDDKAAKAAMKEIKGYYEQYLVSDAYKENCKAFYDIMNTIDETSSMAYNKDEEQYFAYYNSYMNAINSMYSAVQDASKNGNLVIIVSIKDGKAVCTLSNSEADPRNE